MTDESPDPIGERVARLEGVVETEDKLLERGLEAAKHGQVLIAAIVGLVVAGSLAMLVYLLQRLDTLQSQHEPPQAATRR